jgi:hypothetical protein
VNSCVKLPFSLQNCFIFCELLQLIYSDNCFQEAPIKLSFYCYSVFSVVQTCTSPCSCAFKGQVLCAEVKIRFISVAGSELFLVNPLSSRRWSAVTSYMHSDRSDTYPFDCDTDSVFTTTGHSDIFPILFIPQTSLLTWRQGGSSRFRLRHPFVSVSAQRFFDGPHDVAAPDSQDTDSAKRGWHFL